MNSKWKRGRESRPKKAKKASDQMNKNALFFSTSFATHLHSLYNHSTVYIYYALCELRPNRITYLVLRSRLNLPRQGNNRSIDRESLSKVTAIRPSRSLARPLSDRKKDNAAIRQENPSKLLSIGQEPKRNVRISYRIVLANQKPIFDRRYFYDTRDD